MSGRPAKIRPRRSHQNGRQRGAEDRRITLHIKAIRKIPCLLFSGRERDPIVTRKATNAMFELLTIQKLDFDKLSDGDRSHMAASRAKILLETAINVAKDSTKKHWSVVGIWKGVMGILRRQPDWYLTGGIFPERVVDVVDAFIKARLDYQHYHQSSRETECHRDFRGFLKALDDWIMVRDTIKFMRIPKTSYAIGLQRTPEVAMKNEDAESDAAQGNSTVRPVNVIDSGIFRDELLLRPSRAPMAQYPISGHTQNCSCSADTTGTVTIATATLKSMYDEIEAMKKEITQKSITVEMAEVEMLRNKVGRLEEQSVKDTARIREVEAEREAQDFISAQLSTVCQKLLDNNHELRAEINALRTIQDHI